MDWKDLVSTASAVGALLSAFATFLTVREIARQRRTAYRPELAIPAQSVSINLSEADPTDFGLWRRSDEDVASRYFALPILNIGLGAAKRVRADWDCPTEQMVASITNLIGEKGGVEAKLNGRVVELSGPGPSRAFIAPPRSQEIDVILPAGRSQVEVNLTIPLIYVALATAMLRASLANRAILVPQELKLKVFYSDIADKDILVSYTIVFDLIFASEDRVEARLTPRRIDPRRRWVKKLLDGVVRPFGWVRQRLSKRRQATTVIAP